MKNGIITIFIINVDGSIGAVLGAFGGSSVGLLTNTIASGVTNFLGSIASDLVAEDEVNIVNAIVSGGLGAVFGLISGAGAQAGKGPNLKNARMIYKKNLVRIINLT